MLIIEDLIVTVKCRTIKELLLYFVSKCKIGMDSLSCSFTSAKVPCQFSLWTIDALYMTVM